MQYTLTKDTSRRGKTTSSGTAIEMNGPIRLHNLRVDVGDLIIADDSGVCVVPADHVEYVIDTIESIAKEEAVMAELIVADAPLTELKPLFRKRYS